MRPAAIAPRISPLALLSVTISETWRIGLRELRTATTAMARQSNMKSGMTQAMSRTNSSSSE